MYIYIYFTVLHNQGYNHTCDDSKQQTVIKYNGQMYIHSLWTCGGDEARDHKMDIEVIHDYAKAIFIAMQKASIWQMSVI